MRSPLKNKIKVTLLGTQTEFDPAEDTPKPIPFDRPGDVPTVRHGDWVFLKIENASPSDLNVAVLDFQPDWGISQVLPLKSSFEEIDSGGEPLVLPLRAWLPDGYDQGSEPLVLPLRAWLPDGYDQGSDTLKILAAVDPADFRVLELPALDQPIAPKGMRGGNSLLGHLLSALGEEKPRTRNLEVAANPSEEWTSAQVIIHVERQAAGPR